jgi:hypothetical protein
MCVAPRQLLLNGAVLRQCAFDELANIQIQKPEAKVYFQGCMACPLLILSVRRMGGRLRTKFLLQLCGGSRRKPSGQFDGDLARLDIECKGGLKKDMENLYEAVVEPDGRLRLSSAVHLEKGLKVLVAVPRSEKDSALSGIALSEPSLADDWLNPEEEEAWTHLQ